MPTVEEFEQLRESWFLKLRAENKSKGSITTYGKGLTAYSKWCTHRGDDPRLTGEHVQAFLAEFLGEERGGKPTTAANYLTAIRLFVAWCVAEEELPRDEIAGLAYPKVGKYYRPPLSVEELAAMVATCDNSFMGRRDAALLLFMVDTGGRSNEITGLLLSNLWVPKGRVLFKGKGDKERLAAFTPETALALDRYLRMRRRHALATTTDRVWLPAHGRTFGYDGLWEMVKSRAALADVVDVHPHRFRRTFADNWLSEGGSVDGLMAIAGWENMEMIKVYAGARANVRALEEHQRIFGQQ